MTSSTQTRIVEPLFSASLHDRRADKGRRDIAISGDRVTIRRRYHGIDMRVSLEVAAYHGVALCLRRREDDALVYEIRLVHRDDDLSVVLDEALDDRDIVADWRLWARALGLPALVERQLGHYEIAEAAAVDRSGVAEPRRSRASKRRPRFLMRRKPALLPDQPVVHRAEREIIARD